MIDIIKKRSQLQTGLDIGSSSIKLVQITSSVNNPRLVNFDLVETDETNPEDFKSILEDIGRRASVKEVNIAIAGPAVVVRYIDLPKMTQDELKSSMKFEAEKYIPFAVKDVILDCQLMEETGDGKIRVLLAAAKREELLRRVNIVQEAGLSVNVVDCDSFALVNAFLLNYPDIDNTGNIALLNLGERITTIDILKGRIPHFTRELQIGGWDFSKALSGRLNIDMKAASSLKEEPKERLAEVIDITKPILTHMIEEIKLSLDYYENQMGVSVDEIYLTGGLSAFRGLVDIFNEALGISCRLWDPFKRVTIAKEIQKDRLNSVKNKLAIALGLALRA